MPQVIFISHDTTLINRVGKVFHMSYALLCRYHMTNNVRGRLKHAVDTKQNMVEDEKWLNRV